MRIIRTTISLAAAVLIPLAMQAQIDISALQQISPDQTPPAGTFWLVKGACPSPDGSPTPPLPFIPPDLADLNLPIYSMGTGQFVIDDSAVDYAALSQLASEHPVHSEHHEPSIAGRRGPDDHPRSVNKRAGRQKPNSYQL